MWRRCRFNLSTFLYGLVIEESFGVLHDALVHVAGEGGLATGYGEVLCNALVHVAGVGDLATGYLRGFL
jgi:hypothetical protein